MRWQKIRIAAAVALLAALAGATSTEGSEEKTGPRLELMWTDPHRLFPVGWKRAERQTAALFEDIGVDVLWRDTDDPTVDEDAIIRVLLVKSEPASWGLDPGAMGAILSRREPQAMVYIFFPAVLRTLRYRPEVLMERFLTEREKRDVARAMSGVIAHEIIHAVVPRLPHADSGLTKCSLDRDFLVRAKGPIHPTSAAHFNQALAERVTTVRR